MTLEQKIQKANSLKQEINDIKDFIKIIVDGQKYDERYNGQNYFRGISLSAEIWTGTQTCDYNRKMNNTDTIKSFVNAGLEQLKVLLKEKQEELEKMFS